MTTKKYILTEETKKVLGVTLRRIKALRDFGGINAGTLGGWIKREENLSHEGNAWVYGNAKVCGDAWVYGNAKVCGDAEVYGNAKVCGDADYIVFKNWWSSGRYFTWTRSNNLWKVGCFHGTGEDLIKKAYADSEKSGREYERVVRYVESILTGENNESKTKK